MYLLILSTQFIVEYKLRSCILPKVEKNLHFVNIFNRLLSRPGSRKFRGNSIKAIFFSSFTFVSGNISIKEGNFLSFYQIQRCNGTIVTNSVFIIILVSRDLIVAIIDENKSWWLFERSGRCSQESCLTVMLPV